ncbi:lantibiotic dehydratase [Streptomyces sp. RKND-216]|nr:lantibiotic dehydratase [Streptomyces sp. RKND-216]
MSTAHAREATREPNQEETGVTGELFHRPFVLRVAGLPVETVQRLRCPGSRQWADEVLDASTRSRAAGEAVGDLLHDLVGGCEDGGVRRRLLKLRRELFNNRLPHDPEAAVALVAALDARVAEKLTAWLADRRHLAARTADGAEVLAGELDRTRTELRALAGERRLGGGLLLASPSLDAQVDGYAAGPPARADGSRDKGAEKRHRKIERSLLAYLYRTACKTSPFSTFTGLALGEFTDGPRDAADGADPLQIRVDDVWTSHTRLNVVALGRLAQTVLDDPERRDGLPVTLASGWGHDEDRVRYVRRWVTTGDDDTAVTFDSVKDRLFFLRRSGALERMLAFFERRPEIRYGELGGMLADEEPDATAEDVDRYLAALLDLGMLQVPCLRIGVHDTDPLRAFQASLRGLDRDWADSLADDLAGPLARIDEFAGAAPERRRTLLAELRDSLAAIQRGLGAGEPRVPQTVLYEDAAPVARSGCDLAAWSRIAGEPLREVERALPAFDVTLPQRLTFQGFFTARFGQGGRCDDLLKLVHDFHEDFFDQYISFTAKRSTFDAEGRYVPEENWLGLPRIKALDTARQTFFDGMREVWERSGASAAGSGVAEVEIGAGLLDAVAGGLDGVAPAFAPLSHHLQLAERAGDPLVVLNRSYGGLSFPFSRFTHCFDGLADRLREETRRLAPDGAVFAEITGGPVTSNLNLHDRLLDYEIVCPGETGGVPEEYRLHLDDLYIVHDADADRLVLRSTRLDREVIPVYLGYLVPLALPEIPRTLLLLSPTSMTRLDVWGGVPQGEPDEGVTTRPRVRHGSVVLSRRSWSAPASALPLRGPGDTDADWYLGWHRWRRRHRLPDRVFATVSDGGGRGATSAKPQYVDFDSHLSLTAFEALLRTAEARVVFREALPDEDDLHTVSGRGRHVAEMALETAPAPEGRTRT